MVFLIQSITQFQLLIPTKKKHSKCQEDEMKNEQWKENFYSLGEYYDTLEVGTMTHVPSCLQL